VVSNIATAGKSLLNIETIINLAIESGRLRFG
jgi:hypothetical protein